MTPELEEAKIEDLASAISGGSVSAVDLVAAYLDRIERLDRGGPGLRSVIEVNPDALDIAASLDHERRERGPRGRLHGLPILLKDNIDTADRMQTCAGSLALVGDSPARDAGVAAGLRRAGAVILGKANLSEWANFRSRHSSSGWSGRGGQCRNPYVLDRSPCGSSSGSAAAVAASLCAAALGTETDGSVVCPSGACGIVGIKPTVGLTSRAGVIPISHSQDTVGTHGRCVADAAALLAAIADADGSSSSYTDLLDTGALRGARLGVARTTGFGASPVLDGVIEESLRAMAACGATLVDPAPIPSQEELGGEVELTVLLHEFKHDLNLYLAARTGVRAQSLAELIAFNEAHAATELVHFGQDRFVEAEATGGLSEQKYVDALEKGHRLSRTDGIDRVMDEHHLDALVAPTGAPAWPIDHLNGDHHVAGSSTPAAQAGYPIVTVPAGFCSELPVGVSFIGRAYSEPRLIALAYAFEQATMARRRPRFVPTLDLD